MYTGQGSPETQPGMARQCDSLALWYQPGSDDLIYRKALDACQGSKARLANILPDQANQLTAKDFDEGVVRRFVTAEYQKALKSLAQSKLKWLSEASNSIASVAVHLGDLLDPLVPQSPEYTIPFGCLMVIFKILVTKQEKREKAVTIFDNLLRKLDSLELYKVVLPTDTIKAQLAATSIDILELVVCVTEWCAIGRLSKIVDIVLLNSKYDFEEGVAKVEESYKMLRRLVKEATTTITVASYETLKQQSGIIDCIADYSKGMATQIAQLRQTVDSLQIDYTRTQLIQVRNWASDLTDALLPSESPFDENCNIWQPREFHLSPKDHWEENGMLNCLEEWSRAKHASLLAIFGPTMTASRDSWVTEFSLDMIQALRFQEICVPYVICDRQDDGTLSPAIVIKKLICQLLEQDPELILRTPGICNQRVFQRTVTFDQACSLFSKLVAESDLPVVVVVDRVDCCVAVLDDANESGDLIGFLSELLTTHAPRLKVVVTSADAPPADEDIPAGLPISMCTICTGTRHAYRESSHHQGHGKFEVVIYYTTVAGYKQAECLTKLSRLESFLKESAAKQRDITGVSWRTRRAQKRPLKRATIDRMQCAIEDAL